MSSLFTFESVSLKRGETRVLDDLDVEIPTSGITVVVGESGSGKSTLLRCCNLLESPDRGRISFRGQPLDHVEPRAHRRRVAMVFQTPTVFAGTGLDNLCIAHPDLDLDLAGSLMRQVGLPVGLLDREADTLSGGEAQRLCLARALATDPEVVLADESTSALDRDAAAVLEELARDLADRGTPILWVTHDRDQMLRMADHLIELDHGRLVRSAEA